MMHFAIKINSLEREKTTLVRLINSEISERRELNGGADGEFVRG